MGEYLDGIYRIYFSSKYVEMFWDHADEFPLSLMVSEIKFETIYN